MKLPGSPIKCLDHGLVRCMDYMGTDEDIVHAARVSYDPSSTKQVRGDRGLIRYLYRHKHTTPFEMCELKLYLKMPIYVARQWIRHRTANINEYSGRYSVMKDEFHAPTDIRKQSKSNKQGSDGIVPISELLIEDWNTRAQRQFDVYADLVENDAAREMARIHLPLSTYTEFYWKIDLHNLLHFLKLRTDPHAQLEIRIFADAIESIVKQLWPLAHEAWVDYSKEAYNLSRMDLDVLRTFFTTGDNDQILHDLVNLHEGMTEREKSELIAALVK